ncbi:hypothetical protein QWY93_03770 [Echinicola jeungdonensis]|uniref:Uncharacterized protein n=1 Tax=Echinicola jeungdonensis TaxID=709343 RepID=A0ABV5J1A3_9BACT|nr:hypothetical protein [Echinicola jeungdonensis]MDN3668444.1 hypothetical protein [Echinicola jeungdonensis]
MNNSRHPIDKVFHQKLSQHQIKPDPMAWERLAIQLNRPNKSNRFLWLKVAAILVIIMVLGILALNLQNSEVQRQLAHHPEKKVNPITPKNIPFISPKSIQPGEVEKDFGDNKTSINSIDRANYPNKPSSTEENLSKINNGIPNLKKPSMLEKPTIDPIAPLTKKPFPWKLAHPKVENISAISEDQLRKINQNEVTYSVTIISNGISDNSPSDNILVQIEGKFNSLNNLLNKVDQGYAQLQDAKNNLFTSLINQDQKQKSQ